jgi:protocatechuate 3,4-dioxygenase beta subunit
VGKTIGVVAFLGVAAIAAGAAWWALSGGGAGPAGDATSAVTAPESGTPGSDGDTAQPGVGRARPNGPKRAGDPAADASAVAGLVVAVDGKPVAGATVECFAVPEGEPDDQTRIAQRALGAFFGDDREMKEIAREIGGVGAATSGEDAPAQMQRAMRTGQRAFSRVASDPAALNRAMDLGRMFTTGLEDDAPLAAVATATTDASGSFRLDGLAKGSVELRVHAPRFQRKKSRVAVGSLDVRFELAPAGAVAGVVRCEGEPVANAEVRFRTRTVRTGSDGRFTYDGARPPREPVIASAPGCVTRGVWAQVEVGKDPQEVVLDLDPAGRVEGRVTAAGGAPVAGAVVDLAGDASGMMGMFMRGLNADAVFVPPPSATTRDDGTYALDGVPAKSLRLRATAPGFLASAPREARVPPRGVVPNVDFELLRESVVEGRVTDASGAPIADAEVKVDVPGEGMMRMAAQFMGGIFRSGRTDGDGRYRVTGLPAGTRTVTAEADGFLDKKVTVTLPAESSLTQDFALQPGFRVTGRVVAPDGAPVAGASVRVTARGGSRQAAFFGMVADATNATTSADGRFEVKGLQEGPYDVAASAPKYLEGTVSGIDAGADVTVTLGAAATIRGVVVTAKDGTPVAGATILRRGKQARGTGNPILDQFQRDPAVSAGADGTFEISGLAPGQYEVFARAKGYAESPHVKIDVAAGATHEGVSLGLPPGSALAGRVVRKSDGTGVEGALVWVAADSGPFRAPDLAEITGEAPTAPPDSVSAKTAADGSFVLEGLTPGKVTLEVRAAGFASRSVPAAEVPSGANLVEMSEGGAMEGLVFDKSGVPTEGAQVILTQAMMGMGYTRTATTDRAGRYRIERIPPGGYSAMVLDPDSPMGMGGMASVSVRDGETTKKDFGKRAAGAPVEGTVVAEGRGLEGATVMLVGGAAGFLVAETDANGRFRIDHVEAGEYSVMVQTAASMGGGSPAGRVTVGADGKVQSLSLEVSLLAVEGSVTDAETGTPIGFAQVVLLDPAKGSGATLQDMLARQKGQGFTDATGRFRIANVPKGTFSLRVTASTYAEAEVEGVVAGGQAVRVTMSRGIEFAVTVTGPDGKPVAGAMVVPEDAGGREGLAFDITMTKSTGPDGVARLRMQPGRYVFHVRATGYPSASVTAEAAAGSAAVRLEAGGGLEVLVRGAGGAPVAGATVRLLDATGAAIDEAATMANFLGAGSTTDAEGRARRDGLRPGAVTVVVKTPTGKEARAAATIVAGDTTKVEVATE